MANVFDTARYILEKQGTLPALKLEILCYYAQAWSLTWDGITLFAEDFEAWSCGPICKELYNKTKGKYNVTAPDETGGENDLTDEQKETIDTVLEYYAEHNTQWLCQLSKMEEPYIKARQNINETKGIIAKTDMMYYYSHLDDDNAVEQVTEDDTQKRLQKLEKYEQAEKDGLLLWLPKAKTEMLKDICPADVVSYLESKGWTIFVKREPEFLLYDNDTCNRRIRIPCSMDDPEYDFWMERAFEGIARQERRITEQVMMDVVSLSKKT